MAFDDINGVGNVTEDRLNTIGISSVEDLAKADVDDLEDEGIGQSRAESLIKQAKRKGVMIQTGEEVAEEYENRGVVTTGMDALDDILGDGFMEGHMVGIPGPSSVGKSQLVFQSLCRAVEETGKPAVYIETEKDRYDPERLASLANEEGTQEKIYRIPVRELESQLLAYESVIENMDDVCIVAVDSFTARFRLSEQFQDRTSLGDRSTAMAEHLNLLERLSEEKECPVLLTLQIYGNPQAYGSDQTWGGELLSHMLSYKVSLREGKGATKKATIQGHSGQSEDTVLLNIGETEIEATEEP